MKEDKKINIKFNVLAIISIIIFSFAVAQKTLQNDTFYTIKIGEYILKNGITMQDPFSWHTLSYTFPHWAYDVLIYLIYNVCGNIGVYISTIMLTAILGIIIYYMNNKFTKNKPITLILTIASLFLLKGFLAARAQLVTFILFALELLFIEGYLDTKKKRYAAGLIIIPILIANFHVAVFPFYFVIYLPYIAEYLLYILFDAEGSVKRKINRTEKKIEKNKDIKKQEKLKEKLEDLKNRLERLQNSKKNDTYKIRIVKRENIKYLIIIMIICIFTGLLTPLKDVPYTYLLKTLKGNSTQNISEHLPLTLIEDTKFIIVIVLFLAVLTFTDSKIRLCDLFMLGGLTFMTFMSRRQESLFVIFCIPIFNRMVTELFDKYDKGGIEKMTKMMASICGNIITISLIILISIVCYGNKNKNSYINEKIYPVEACQWIKENLNLNEIKLYNGYNYGSYLILQDIPVFIDSRADLYLPEFNKGVKIFEDFLNIGNLNITNLEEKFEQYGFTHFLIQIDSRLVIYFEAKPDIYNKIYSDENFCIYERKK